MNLRYADRRYENDPTFHQLVKALENAIETLQLSPSEIREAAVFACLRVEMRRGPKPIVLSPELSLYLDRNKVDAEENGTSPRR